MFAGQAIIQASVMNKKRAKALEQLILHTAEAATQNGKLCIQQLYQRLPNTDRQRIRSCLKRNGYKYVNEYYWEKRDEKMGKTSYTKG